MKKAAFVTAILLSLSTVLMAQRVNQAPTPTFPSMISKPALNSFFDMNKFEMRHSYSMSLTSFGSGQNFTEGLYTNTIFYKFDSPLLFRMDVGVIHDPFGTQTFGHNANNAELFLKNISFTYKPWENTSIFVGFSQQPYSVSNAFNFYRRYDRSFYDPFNEFSSDRW